MSVRSRVYRERRLPAGRPLAAIIAGLWRNGEQGVWYDTSDLSTMFQDAAGTLPVYAPGQGQVDPPVGLWLDKRLGLARGVELNASGNFTGWNSQAGWSIGGDGTATATSVSGGTAVLRNLSLSANTFYEITVTCSSCAAGSWFVRCGFDTLSGNISSTGTYKFRMIRGSNAFVYVVGNAGLSATFANISVRELPGNHAYQATTTSRPTLSARYNLLTGTESLATQSVPVAATAYTLTTAGPGSVTLSGAASGTYTAGSRMVTCTAGALTLTVLGSVTQADLRPANDGVGLPPYQRVVDASTYDTAGFPLYLKFDGVDDFLQTASIDFRGSDKVFCAASFRKLSDATTGFLFELSAIIASNPGSFYITAPGAVNSGNIKLATKGTTEVNVATTAAGYPSPISAIASAVMDIAAPISTLRINGVVAQSSSASLGSGSLGNYPLYIGRRAGSSLPFNGRLYGLLIRGAATPDATITKVERYLNQKVRIY